MSETQSPEAGESIVKASFAVGLAHLCLKFTGLAQAIVAAKYISGRDYDAVYVVAFEGIIYTLFLVGEESIGPSFLPVFLGEKDKQGEEDAWALANVVLTLQTLLLAVAMALVLCFPDFLIGHFTDWQLPADQDRWATTRTGLMWLAPSLLCLSLGSTTYMLLNGYKRFFLAAFGDASWKICVVIALIGGQVLFGWDVKALIFGLLIGSVAKLLTHLWGLRRQLHFLRPSLNWRNPALRTMLLLILPLLAGILVAKVRDVFNNVWVLSTIPEIDGLMQANSLGRKLFLAISWLVPYAVSIAMFPFFCELVDREDHRKLGNILTSASRMMLCVLVPAALLIVVLAYPLCAVLLLRGEFDLQSAQWTALSTACYTLVMPAFALEYILIQGFFANRKMVSITVIGMIFSFFSVGVSYVFIVRIFGPVRLLTEPHLALVAVALGYVLSRTLKTMAMILVLRRRVPMFPLGPTLGFLVRLAAISAVTAGAAWGTARILEQPLALADAYAALADDPAATMSGSQAKLRLLLQMAAAGFVAGLAFLGAARALQLREPFDVWYWGTRKFAGLGQRLQKLRERFGNGPSDQ